MATLMCGLFSALPAVASVPPAVSLAARSQSNQAGPLITYTGLRVHSDGSSTLLVNLTTRTEVAFSQEGRNLSFVLEGAKVELKNNKNPLRAEHFHVNVLRAKLDDTKEGARLSVTLRSDVVPVYRMAPEGSSFVLRIDVPPATE